MAEHHPTAEQHAEFDAEPARVLSEGEPHTPMWLPGLGVALFVAAGLWLSAGDDGEDRGTAAPEASGAASATPTPTPPRSVAAPKPVPMLPTAHRPRARPSVLRQPRTPPPDGSVARPRRRP